MYSPDSAKRCGRRGFAQQHTKFRVIASDTGQTGYFNLVKRSHRRAAIEVSGNTLADRVDRLRLYSFDVKGFT
jgi:hypothetical protein